MVPFAEIREGFGVDQDVHFRPLINFRWQLRGGGLKGFNTHLKLRAYIKKGFCSMCIGKLGISEIDSLKH